MANTYTQIHLQFVFAVKYRQGLIHPAWKDKLYKYITGIVQQHHHKMIIINGVPDHVHLLVGMRPTQSISDLLQDIKGSSSKWINEKGLCDSRFAWQEGYGAFSYARSQLGNVIRYIKTQEEHHRRKSFQEEYLQFLEKFEVDYDERYIFGDLI